MGENWTLLNTVCPMPYHTAFRLWPGTFLPEVANLCSQPLLFYIEIHKLDSSECIHAHTQKESCTCAPQFLDVVAGTFYLISREFRDWTNRQRKALARLFVSTGCWAYWYCTFCPHHLKPVPSDGFARLRDSPCPCQARRVYASVFDRMTSWTQRQPPSRCLLLSDYMTGNELRRELPGSSLQRTVLTWLQVASGSSELFCDSNLTKLPSFQPFVSWPHVIEEQ